MVKIRLAFTILFFSSLSWSADLPLAAVKDHQHKMYLVAYKHESLDQARDQLMKSLVLNSSNLSKIYALSTDLKQLGVEFDGFQKSLLKVIEGMNSQLPVDQPIDMMLYFFPKKEGASIEKLPSTQYSVKGTPLGDLQVTEVRLDRVDGISESEFDAYGSIASSVDSYNAEIFKPENQQQGFADQPAFLSAVAIQMSLKKDHSAIQIQLLAGLKPGQQEKVQEAKEVTISHIEIPQGKGTSVSAGGAVDFSTHPVMLASMEVKQDEVKTPRVRLKFGAFAGFNTYGRKEYQGSLALADDLVAQKENWSQLSQLSSISPAIKKDWLKSCQIRQQSTPTLKGKFSNAATDSMVDPALRGKKIDFSIFAIDLIVGVSEEVTAELADIRFSTLGLDCLIMEKVSQQFLQEIDGTIKSQLRQALKVDDLSSQIVVSLDDDWDN